tara:strand:+ start:990 stop:1223 length:234 start_codon:yes stop_codon:yes gene_type:complete
MNITKESEDYAKSREPKCCICGGKMEYEEWSDKKGKSNRIYGHNADPLAKGHGRCCETCNYTEVIKARIEQITNNKI